ncbi:uncharacterized protein RCC_09928 [Ramularia collo-cygni]|uniref:Uncharacterized protein n=1 Tax=Ramularia collo-cygni TaxID=112498 RepID=A0A2D3VIR6_9PEZI|nr:uncharacterized protein RCC_09928 [Ramularia collo-cygni]CZT24211.1 uncharacterized protein RCC_09928 [Ramularia collo-cygni]
MSSSNINRSNGGSASETDTPNTFAVESFFSDAFDTTGEAAARERVLYPDPAEALEPLVDLTLSDDDEPEAVPREAEAQPEEPVAFQGEAKEIIEISDDDSDSDSDIVVASPRYDSMATRAANGEPVRKRQKLADYVNTSAHDDGRPSQPVAAGGPASASKAPALQQAVQALPQAAIPAPLAPAPLLPPPAAQAAAVPTLATAQPGQSSIRLVWNYKNKYILDLIMDKTRSIPSTSANKERLFNAMIQPQLDRLGYQGVYEYKKMGAQFQQKNRVGRSGHPTWTDPDWDRIKADRGDARDKIWRGAVAASIHAEARQLGIAMVRN